MKKSKKNLVLAIAACTLFLTLAFGGTLAYMADTEGITNTVTVGRVNIDLEEPGYPGNDSDEVKNIIPNQEIVKDPQIENTGSNDALVFLRVEVPHETFTNEDDGTWEQKKQDLFKLKGISDQWELLRTETITGTDGKEKTSYVYGYKKALAKKSTTDKLFQKVQMKNAMESDLSGNVEDIVVTACAIQATDIPDIDLTPGSDGTIGKDTLNQVYEIFLKQSGDQKSRPADEGNKPQDGSIGQITYGLDGGTIEGAKKSYTAADYGYVPPTPTKKGFKFIGWIPTSIPTDSTGNVTFSAEWEESTARLLSGSELNKKMEKLVRFKDAITAIQQSNEKPSNAVIKDVNSLISAEDSSKPVYAWSENDIIKWWSDAEYVKADKSLSHLCNGMTDLTDISGLSAWDISETTDLSYAFCDTRIADLTPLSTWNTSNVVNMNSLFTACISLESLAGLENWNTSSVTDMSYLFSSHTSIQVNSVMKLNDITSLANWDVSNVTNMHAMFHGCINLADLSALVNWNVSNVTDMCYMFSDRWNYTSMKLTGLAGLEKWNTANVTNMSSMFYGCQLLTDLVALTNWQTGNVTNMSEMFYGCSRLADLTPLANWQTGNVTNMSGVFSHCSQLADLNGLTKWNVGSVTNMCDMFNGCQKLADTSAINNWDIANVTEFTKMFRQCPSHPTFTKRAGTWRAGTFTPAA